MSLCKSYAAYVSGSLLRTLAYPHYSSARLGYMTQYNGPGVAVRSKLVEESVLSFYIWFSFWICGARSAGEK